MYTLLIFAYLKPEQQLWSNRASVSSGLSVSARVCVCVCDHRAGVQRAARQKLMLLWKLSWLHSYSSQGVPFWAHLEMHVIAFLIEFHVLVTGGWTNPHRVACNTKLNSSPHCFSRVEAAHTQLKGYETFQWNSLIYPPPDICAVKMLHKRAHLDFIQDLQATPLIGINQRN